MNNRRWKNNCAGIALGLGLVSLLVTLTGCISHGSRTVRIEFLGQKIEVSDHTENDETGKPNFWITFDDWGKKAIDALFGWATKPPPVEATTITTVEVTPDPVTP